MVLDLTRTRHYLREFDFKKLFVEELGWDQYATKLDVTIDRQSFILSSIAEKRGMAAFRCNALPDYTTRRKIERQVAKSAHEHLIVYTDPAQSTQIWQWVKREAGKPSACREQHYHRNQPGDALIQKLQALSFSLEEEESLTIVDVATRARAAFDVERVTRRFYDRFKNEHAAFLKFLQGIPDEENQRWYASVMLNRLMFIYFIQKKDFLSGDRNYLRNKLAESKKRGAGRFYSEFLCPLFFEGFAKKEQERSTATKQLLGKVPYLNGGIFQRHQIEELHGKNIQIPDAAFEKLFDFLDQYQWHLDERPLRNDNEINPDVLGYIFEKYINQKQMGAYYTKEDITEYISKNTVIPFLFDVARQKCKLAFEGDHSIWRLLQADPDRYIYDAVKKSVDLPLPEEISIGLKDVSKRTQWNKPASHEYALLTEIWREVVARRRRYEEVRMNLANGEIHSINDFITYNLDIRQFAQDVIENSEGPELLRAFYHAIEKVTVLDPTCGSGAFLFAALNILEPLYEACLERMEAFVSDLELSGQQHRPEKFSDFRKVLERVAQHPNRRYFVLKSIIVNNLFGVDIMEEAVEICKLRLFLKLVAQVEQVQDIEPLPDIDFNIRAGNTLVGFANYNEVKRAITSKLDFDNTMVKIEERAQDIDRLFGLFRQQQTEFGGDVTREDKQELRNRLKVLEDELNRYFAGEYGVSVGMNGQSPQYQRWLASHKPFHWFIEFYGIIKNDGFDVIIGNPPYVSAREVRKEYSVKNYVTAESSDIYAWVLERASSLLSQTGRSGMIVALSITFSSDFEACRRLLFKQYGNNWFSSYGRIPAALFSHDVRVRNTIHLAHKTTPSGVQYTTRLHRWFEACRPYLFETLQYAGFSEDLWQNKIPKLNSTTISKAFENCFRKTRSTIETFLFPRQTPNSLYFKKTAYNWLNFCKKLPPCYDSDGNEIEHTKFGEIYFAESNIRDLAFLFLNGKIMFIYWCIIGDDFDVTRWMFASFPINLHDIPEEKTQQLLPLTFELHKNMMRNLVFKLNAGRKVGNYNLAKCRDTTDKSDTIFAQLLGIQDAWEEIELFYSLMIKTDFFNESKKV